MAKEYCAMCGKLVGVSNRYKLGDGNYICVNCAKLAGAGAFTNYGRLTLADLQQNAASDPRALARQEKRARKDEAALDRFGLDFDRYNIDDLNARNTESAKAIAASLAGSKMYSFGSLLSGDPNQTFLMELERAQVEQNFILMRQNEEIIRLMNILYHELKQK